MWKTFPHFKSWKNKAANKNFKQKKKKLKNIKKNQIRKNQKQKVVMKMIQVNSKTYGVRSQLKEQRYRKSI